MNAFVPLQVPLNEKKVLLHTCCAPCSCAIIKQLVDGGIEPAVYFYNPNIYPREEYELRKREVLRYIRKMRVACVDADHEIDQWFEAVQGFEEDVERGRRCSLCFEMRLGKTAAYSAGHGFKVFATSLAISRWKDHAQVDRAGRQAASLFPGLIIGTIAGGFAAARSK